jgi:hypothetical protein
LNQIKKTDPGWRGIWQATFGYRENKPHIPENELLTSLDIALLSCPNEHILCLSRQLLPFGGLLKEWLHL